MIDTILRKIKKKPTEHHSEHQYLTTTTKIQVTNYVTLTYYNDKIHKIAQAFRMKIAYKTTPQLENILTSTTIHTRLLTTS